MVQIEKWKSLAPLGFSKYEVSNFGKIRNVKTNKILKGADNGYGYIQVSLSGDDKKIYIRRRAKLVALMFIPNNDPENKRFLDHKDTNRSNDNVSNLRWVTASENMRNPITLEKLRINHLGKALSDDTKEKLRQIALERWSNRTEEEILEIGRKISSKKKGKNLSEEHKRKLSEVMKEKSIHPVNKGTQLTEEQKRKIGEGVHRAAQKRREQNVQ